MVDLKHPDYNNNFLPEKDVFNPEFKRDSRGRYFMQLPGYGKWMVSVEPGSKIISQGSEDEAGDPGTDPGSIRTGSLHASTVITIGDSIYLDGGDGCIYVGDYDKRVGASMSLCGSGIRGYSGNDLVFAFFLEEDGDFGKGDMVIGDNSSDNYMLWDDSEGTFYVKGTITATSGYIGDWEIDTCLKSEYIYTDDSATKIELCPGNPGHVQVAYSPTGTFSVPGDVYMVQLTQGSTADAGGTPIPRLDVYRAGVKRAMLNSDGLYFFESDGTTIATSILSGATNEENLSNATISDGSIGGQPVSNVATVSNSVADATPTGLTVVSTDTEENDDGTITANVTLTWDAIVSDTLDYYFIRYKRSSFTYYNYVEVKDNSVTIDGLMPAVSYDFAVASVNKYGATSAYSSTVTDTTAADNVAPSDPTGLIVIGGFKKIVLDWDANTEYDLSEYHIYRNTSNDSGTATKVGTSGSSQFIDDLSSVPYSGGESSSTYYYWIKAIDTSRNESGFSSVASTKSKLIDEDSVYYIGASKILLDGTTYLTSWRHPSDFTKIDGGDIYANSITVSQVNFDVVGTDNIVGTINTSSEGMRIDAKYITISGTTIFNSGWTSASNVGALAGKNAADWSTEVTGTGKPSSYADVTQTIINGGLVTTGGITLDDGLNQKAGMTAEGVGDSNVRIWAGNTYANRASAAFRVTQGGALTATSATITGSVTITGGSGISNLSDAGSLATKNSADYSSDVSGTKPPADADKTSSNTSADTSSVNGVSSSIISGWRYGATTYINGGDIYTGTVTANQINVTNLAALSANCGSIRIGGSGNTYGTLSVLDSSNNEVALLNNNAVIVRQNKAFAAESSSSGTYTQFYTSGLNGIIEITNNTSGTFGIKDDDSSEYLMKWSYYDIQAFRTFLPDTSGTRDLGSISLKWDDVYCYTLKGPAAQIWLDQTGRAQVTNHFDPTGSGVYNLGGTTRYWNEIHYVSAVSHSLVSYDDGVELLDGRKVSDIEAIKNIKASTKKSQYGVPYLDKKSFPKNIYHPAKIAEKDMYDTEKIIDKDGNKIRKDTLIYKKGEKIGDDGVNETLLMSLVVGALKELDNRLKKLER